MEKEYGYDCADDSDSGMLIMIMTMMMTTMRMRRESGTRVGNKRGARVHNEHEA